MQGAKFLWKLPQDDRQKILDIASTHNLSIPLSQTLLSRGITTKETINSYLFSSLEKDVASTTLMKDAQKAVNRIIKAIDNQEKILIFGDYDVDGITSSSVMMSCLLPLKAQVNFYLPHRVKDGYGLSTKIVRRAAENGYKVIITVDNGTTAFEQAEVAKELGVDLIITDHHRPHDKVPDAFALVNPHQKDCQYPFKEFAGVGVAFKLMSLLYEIKKLQMPNKAYELLLLGTVADVVPLTGENRFWVRYGLKWINSIPSFSFDVLKKNGKVTNPVITSTDIGFKITPQINALGRLEDPRCGVKFLLGSEEKETERVGAVLLELNERRKEVEKSIFDDVEHLVESGQINLENENVILAASKNWPPGVIGLVASRLVSKYGRPTILLHLTSKGKAKGSCRSIDNFNIFDALNACSDVIDQFGGHAQAAGLSLDADKLPELKSLLEARTRELLTPEDFKQKLLLDAEITMSDVAKKLVTDMELFQPFGAENAEPKFFMRQVHLLQSPKLLKDLHIKCSLFSEGIIKPVIFFNRPDLYPLFLAQEEEPFDIAVQISINHWQGRANVELMGIDVSGMKGMK